MTVQAGAATLSAPRAEAQQTAVRNLFQAWYAVVAVQNAGLL
jgi:hypothetical protein